MKLLLLIVSAITVFDANCRNFPDPPDSFNEAQNISDEDHFTEDETHYVIKEPDYYDSTNDYMHVPIGIESLDTLKNDQQLKTRWLAATDESEEPQDPEFNDDKYDPIEIESHDTSKNDQQLKTRWLAATNESEEPHDPDSNEDKYDPIEIKSHDTSKNDQQLKTRWLAATDESEEPQDPNSDEDIYDPIEIESHATSKNDQQLKTRWLAATDESEEPQDLFSTNENQALDQEEKEENGRKLQWSKCKATSICVVLNGVCVKNSTICNGRIVPKQCKGKGCLCCVPSTINKNVTMEIQSMKSDINGIKLDMNSKLKALEDKMMTAINSTTKEIVCPRGFFSAGSQQCFKFYNTTSYSWTLAKARCQAVGLKIAKPTDPVGLRSYLKGFGNVGPGSNRWIGAHGAGSYFIWDRDGQVISNTDSLWYPGRPGSRVSTRYCMSMPSGSSNPTKAYLTQSCSDTRPFVCEKIMN